MTVRFASFVVGLALIASGVDPFAEVSGAEPPALVLTSSRITIAGTSNIHAYSATTTAARLVRSQVAAPSGPSFWDVAVAPGALEVFELTVPAATLASGKDGLDKNMHKALKTDEHPEITFKLLRFESRPAPATGSRAVGVLRVAGVDRQVTIDITTERKDAALIVKGTLALLMTDFGIAPPKAMMGMLKTDPKVTITFEVAVAANLT
jgi:hypothetical protein